MPSTLKVCGLCSKVSEEVVSLSPPLTRFLHAFIDLPPTARGIPTKVCPDCRQSSHDCHRFKDQIESAIARLANWPEELVHGNIIKVEKSQIKTESTVKEDELESSPARKPGPASKNKSKKQTSRDPLALDIDLDAPRATRHQREPEKPKPRPSRASSGRVSLDVVDVNTPRASRHKGMKVPAMEKEISPSPVASNRSRRTTCRRGFENLSGDTLPKGAENAKVICSAEERSLADRASDEGGTISYKKRKALITPSRSTGKVQPPPSKRMKRAYEDDEEEETRGRAPRSARKRYNVEEEDEAPLKPTRSAKKKESPAPAQAKKKPSKAGPKSKKPEKKVYYQMTTDNGKETSDLVEVENNDEDDDEEVFPAVGPYQCEICQLITDTKRQFVNHIKDNHTDVVDEEVLESLESDLRKAEKKKAKAQKKPGPASAKKGEKQNLREVRRSTKPKSAQVEEQDDIEARTCQICNTVVSHVRDMKRHQATKSCQAAKTGKSDDAAVDSPDTTTPNKVSNGKNNEENGKDSEENILGLDGEVVEDKETDQEREYWTKGGVARKYEGGLSATDGNEKQNSGEASTNWLPETSEADPLGTPSAAGSQDLFDTLQNQPVQNNGALMDSMFQPSYF